MVIIKMSSMTCPFDTILQMEELIDISNYCSNVKMRYGNKVLDCTASYIEEDDVIEFTVRYKIGEFTDFFKYSVPSHNFMVTDLRILINSNTASIINAEVEKRI